MSKSKSIIKYGFIAWLLSDEIRWVARRVREIVHGNKDNQ
jgi:hypothetical protein